MDIRGLIIRKLNKKGEVRSSDIVKATGLSRTYINRFFQQLRNEGKITLLGKANRARYVIATERAVSQAKMGITSIKRILRNEGLSEDRVLDDIKRRTGIFLGIRKNIADILYYAFTEMLNNAIEHSGSKKIEVSMEKDKAGMQFHVFDQGIGIFTSIMQKRRINSDMEAIQDLIKGKLTTSPEAHTGEGIFFTSKVATVLTIRSSRKKIIFDNLINDIFIKDIKNIDGTKINFSISFDSKKELGDIFGQYADDSFEFSKTKVTVKLYRTGSRYISRSQARRILSGLDKFKTIILDFHNVETVGQGFADEVFRVWKLRYPKITMVTQNANQNVGFMINRALA